MVASDMLSPAKCSSVSHYVRRCCCCRQIVEQVTTSFLLSFPRPFKDCPSQTPFILQDEPIYMFYIFLTGKAARVGKLPGVTRSVMNKVLVSYGLFHLNFYTSWKILEKCLNERGGEKFQMHLPSAWFLDKNYHGGSKYCRSVKRAYTWNSHSPWVKVS